jgi:hypothetical protein
VGYCVTCIADDKIDFFSKRPATVLRFAYLFCVGFGSNRAHPKSIKLLPQCYLQVFRAVVKFFDLLWCQPTATPIETIVT